MPTDIAAEMGDLDESSGDEYSDKQAAPAARSTFTLSPSDLGKKGAECSPGDVLRIKVVGVDADGNYESQLEGVDKGGQSEDGLAGELRGAMAESDDIGPVQNIMGEP